MDAEPPRVLLVKAWNAPAVLQGLSGMRVADDEEGRKYDGDRLGTFAQMSAATHLP